MEALRGPASPCTLLPNVLSELQNSAVSLCTNWRLWQKTTNTGQRCPFALSNSYLQEPAGRYTIFTRHLLAYYRTMVDTEWLTYDHGTPTGPEIPTKGHG